MSRKNEKRKSGHLDIDHDSPNRKSKEQKVQKYPPVQGKSRTTEDMGNLLDGSKNKYKDKVYIQKETKDFILFWQKESPFSQWYPSWFTVGELTFNCAEQYMMYNKALLCHDESLANEVLETIDPDIQKSIGREAAQSPKFNRQKWNDVCKDVVKTGNIAKFSQNKTLKKQLLDSDPKTLAEASPFDTKWGIGLAANHPDAFKMEKWKGMNLLGEVLMEVRAELLNDEKKH